MKVIKKGLGFLVFSLSLSFSLAASDAREISRFVDNIHGLFSNFYAPKQWKEEHLQWDLAKEISTLSLSADGTFALADFHKRLKSFFQSTRDYHTSISFANNGSSSLPLSLKHIDGSFYLAYVSDTFAHSIPLRAGDKITHFNDRDINDIAKELMGHITNPTLSDWSLAARKLTKRSGMANDPLDKGPVIIKGERDGQELVAQMVWDYNENSVRSKSRFNAKTETAPLSAAIPPELLPTLRGIIEHIDSRSSMLKDDDFLSMIPGEDTRDPGALAQKESFLPSLGKKVIWQTPLSSRWQASISLSPDNKLIGFIRIPSFMPDKNDVKLAEYAEEFGQIVSYMNDKTELLVIDQLNNPGGSVFYLYALASMLTDRALKNPHHKFGIDGKDNFEAQQALKNIDTLIAVAASSDAPLTTLHGYPIDVSFLHHMKSYYQFIAEQAALHKSITDPYFLFGVDYIKPHPLYRYTKKLLILTNELDFSAADFFPAIFQDSQRALIMGATTAGAGGYVLKSAIRNNAHVLGFSYTGSIAFRANGRVLENLGVTPDELYHISKADLQNGFHSFKEAIDNTIKKMLKDPKDSALGRAKSKI